MKNNRVFLSPPHMSGREEEYIKDAFSSNWIAPLGPNVDMFEQEMATFLGVKKAVAVSSGTAALHIALILLGVKKGDSVFCSSLTFVASANPILYQGAEPVFIDSEPDTWNMSPDALERAFQDEIREGRRPKAVIVVNLYGQSAKMKEIVELCELYKVPIIEDAAESLGSTYENKKSGTIGMFGIYSFNGNKIITTSGGGMLVSNNEDAIIRAKFLASQARDSAPYYQHAEIGYNYRMSNILAGIGRAQLKVLESRVNRKREIFEKYFIELSNLPGVKFMPELKNTMSNRWLTTLLFDERESGVTPDKIIKLLEDENIESRHIWKPLHMQPLFRGAKFFPHKCDEIVSEKLFESGVCLPSGTNLSNEEQSHIINLLRMNVKKIASISV